MGEVKYNFLYRMNIYLSQYHCLKVIMIFHKNAYEMKFFQILYLLITEMTIQLFWQYFFETVFLWKHSTLLIRNYHNCDMVDIIRHSDTSLSIIRFIVFKVSAELSSLWFSHIQAKFPSALIL